MGGSGYCPLGQHLGQLSQPQPHLGQPWTCLRWALCHVAVTPQSQSLESGLTVSWVAGQRGSSSGLTQREMRRHSGARRRPEEEGPAVRCFLERRGGRGLSSFH